ncbi:MAG: metal ABC transporter permease [Thermoanaerobaculales bacterium]|jgi:manganese/zinc/iron transport system permease protein|nr:metal ABC transporter permease [Thermoanaerobaculales bacterium]
MTAELEILVIAIVTAVAAALPGAYLVLRRTAMVSDAISHAILPGIVVAFFLTEDLNSPLLLIAAAATGVLTVVLIEALMRSRLVPEDASIGIVFPALFSIGVILISRAASDVHLDTDAVLLGELAFAPFHRLTLAGVDLGPAALWSMGAILILNVGLILLAWKELKLATVDAGLAALLGFQPVVIHYGLMTMVSVTAVGAFDAVGSILVVALMIAPPATAYLLAERLSRVVIVAAVVAAAGAALGWAFALALDVSIAGSIAAASGLLFAAAFLMAPHRGLLAQARRRQGQRLDFAVRMLLVHLLHHERTPEEPEECRETGLHRHLGWGEPWTRRVVGKAADRELIERRGDLVLPTTEGRRLADDAVIGFGA